MQRTSPSGTTVHANNVYTRTGSTTCNIAGGTSITVPYTASSTGYPPDQRCAAIAGCTTLTPARTTVDTIAVVIRYTYVYHTPLGQLLTLVGGDSATPTGWNFSKRNLSRIEPEL